MTVSVEGYAIEPTIGRGGAEIRRTIIHTPADAVLVTIASETRHHEARIERIITDQQLIGV